MHMRGSPRARSGGGGGSSWVPTRQHGTDGCVQLVRQGTGCDGPEVRVRGAADAVMAPRIPTRLPGLPRECSQSCGPETTTRMTYRLPYAVAGRASHGDDVNAAPHRLNHPPFDKRPTSKILRFDEGPRRQRLQAKV